MNNNLFHIKDLDPDGIEGWLKANEESGQIKWDEFHSKHIKSHLKGMSGLKLIKWLKQKVEGVPLADQYKLQKLVDANGPKSLEMRDAIHGDMIIHPLLVGFMKRKEFARLNKIKQLGAVYLKYPCAKHTRFEHCIGTAELAKRCLAKLKENNAATWELLEITEKDELCVTLGKAALLHDIGHAAFSHFWDGVFMQQKIKEHGGKLVDPANPNNFITEWNHEIASTLIIDHIYSDEGIKDLCRYYGLEDIDIEFVKELINPEKLKGLKDDAPWPMKGRPESKAFLYEIVSNSRSGLDVDKLDYLQRDPYFAKGMDSGIPITRIFRNMEVNFCSKNADRTLISVRDKCDVDVLRVYQEREKNHREIYQHPEIVGVEKMIGVILLLIASFLPVMKKQVRIGGQKKIVHYDLAHAVFDMSAYCRITENFIFEFLETTDLVDIPEEHQENFLKAQKINDRIREGDYYAHVGHMKFNSTKDQKKKREQIISDIESADSKIVKEIIAIANEKLNKLNQPFVKKEDLLWDFNCKFDWGMKSDDPISKIPFHNKEKSLLIYRQTREIQATAPEHFQERGIRLYLKNKSAENEVKQAFDELCAKEKVLTRNTSQGFDH